MKGALDRVGKKAVKGLDSALGLAKKGARDVLVGRNPDKVEETRQAIVDETGSPDIGLQGADTIVWLAAAREAVSSTGLFWLDRQPHTTQVFPWTGASKDQREQLRTELAKLSGWSGDTSSGGELMGRATKKSLEQAFIGEAKAHFRLKAFAIKADAEGYRHETAFSLFLSTP